MKKGKRVITIFLILIAIVLVFIYKVNCMTNKESFGGNPEPSVAAQAEYSHDYAATPIPKHIWTYWSDNGNAKESLLVKRCIQSWKHFNPAYEITVLNKTNYREYVDFDISTIKHSNETEARFSDYLRLLLLAKHGGFWMDASIICQKPLDWIIELQQEKGAELVGYLSPNSDDRGKVVENWFFACVAQSPFITDWCAEFLRTRDFASIDDYLHDLQKKKVDLSYVQKGLQNYLASHCATQAVLQGSTQAVLQGSTQAVLQGSTPKYNLVLLSSVENKGPFVPLSENGFGENGASDEKIVDAICKGRYRDLPFIKIRGSERRIGAGLPDFECLFS